MSPKAIGELRSVTRRTGGFCTIIDADALPGTFEEIARATVAGYQEAHIGFHGKPLPRAGVSGTLVGEDEATQSFFVPKPFLY